MNERPTTVSEALRRTVEFLDILDRAAEKLAVLQGAEPYVPAEHHEVQDDLNRIAAWLERHPLADRAMWDAAIFFEGYE